MPFLNPRLALGTLLATPALSQVIDGAQYNHPNAGPPASFFSAAPTMPVAALQTAAEHLRSVPKHGAYQINFDSKHKEAIKTDWAGFKEGAAVVWTADMDVDCDGKDWNCEGNPDPQPETNWGALSAYEVPYVVIPDKYLQANKKALPGNNVAAVICNGNMFYGILGDSDSDTPQVIGEASWLMARTCFPNDGLNGAVGHDKPDVTYIVFTGKDAVLPDTAVDETYLTDFTTLRAMGDKLVNSLAENVLHGSADDAESAATRTRVSPVSKTLLGTAVVGTTLLGTTLGSAGSVDASESTSVAVVSVCGEEGCAERKGDVVVNEEEISMATSVAARGVLGLVVVVVLLYLAF
ncbi:fungal chitosanase of glycosyl hydrolase group 75-domain-containing protein [Aspergillus unguis]